MSSAAVDSATAQMATTSLNEPSATASGPNIGSGGDKPINAAHNEAVIQSASEGRRLYIGNLAYAATEGDLKDFFKDYLIEGVSIPTNPRTTRAVGYAFVDVSTPSEAERAVQDLNNKTVMDRKVSVQIAKKPEDPATTNGDKPADGDAASKRGAGRGRGRAGRTARGGRRGGKGGREDGEASGTEAANGPTNVPGQVEPLTDTTNEALTSTKDDEKKQTKTPKPKQVRNRGPPEDGVPSKTKIMVANLPYDLKEDKLKELFADFKPTGAKIALRPIPRFMVRKLQARNEPRKGRGFAFVTLETEELQQKAIAEMNGKEVEGRELAVKVAIDSPGKEDEALEAQAEAIENKENEASTAEGSGSVAPPSAA